MTPIQVTFISALESAPWGGSEELWSRAALHLCGKGIAIQACVRRWTPVAGEVTVLQGRGIKIVLRDPAPYSLPARFWHAVQRRLRPAHVLQPELRPASSKIAAFQPDLVCISQGSNVDGLHWMEWCHTAGIPYVSVMQANTESLWPTDDTADRLLEAHRNAQATFFVSKANLNLFENQIGGCLSNAKVVRNPFNVSYQVDPQWPETESMIRLACVGRLVPMAKGQDLILQVLALPQWKNRPISISFVGDGPMGRSLRRLATELGVENKVNFLGQVDSLEKIWTEHHALLLPSRYEGLPLALVEAMLCHRPAIVTDIAGNCEVLEDGVSGFVAAFPTVASVANAMERAWESRAELREMGLCAGRQIRQAVSQNPAGIFGDLLLSHAGRQIVG